MRAVPLLVPLLVVLSLSLSGCSAVVALGLGTERGKARVRESVDVLADGHEVRFWERRSKDARATLVLVHGMGGTRDHFTFFAAALPDDVDVIALDLPGFGESTKDPAQHYDRASQVARVRAFIQQRGVTRYHLVGHSMGGMLAAELALRTPAGIESLVLFDPAGIDAPDKSREMPDVLVDSPERFDELMKASFVKPPPVPDFLKQYFADEMQRNAPFAEKVRAETFADWGTLAARLPAIQIPTLVTWGDKDRIIDPSAAALWREALRGNDRSDVVIMRETGHAPMLERPHESVALLFQWWRARGVVR